MSAPSTAQAEQNRPEPEVAPQPRAGTSETAESSSGSSKSQPNLLLDLPKDIFNTILLTLAREDYGSLYRLSGTCQAIRKECQKFMRKHPQHMFRKTKCRPAGMSDSDDSDDDYDCDDWSYRSDELLADEIGDLFDRLSFGSHCDLEALEEWRRDAGLMESSDDEGEFFIENEDEVGSDANSPDRAGGDNRNVRNVRDGADPDPNADADADEALW